MCRSGRATLKNELLDQFPSVTNIDDVLKQKPDVAFVCTPSALHIDSALPLLKSGCHLFIEKPVSHNLNQCDQMIQIAKEKKLTTLVGFQFRFHPVLNQIKEMIDANMLGRIVSVHVHWGEYLPDWHPWEDYKGSYAARPDMGGGVALTLCHPIDYLRWLIGEIETMQATQSPLHVLDTKVDESVLFSLRFASGVIGSVYVDFVQRPPRHTMMIVAEKGTVTWNNATSTAEISLVGQNTYSIEPPQSFERNNLFADEVKHFVDCVKHHKTTCVPLDHGVETLNLILKAMS